MWFTGKGTMRAAASALALLVTAAAFPFAAIEPAKTEALVTDEAGDYDNFAKALQYSLYFYDGNMCGPDVEANNRFQWRCNCHTYDAAVPLKPMDMDEDIGKRTGTNLSASFISKYSDILSTGTEPNTVDVSGGFHDAGDHVKFGLPEAYSGSTISWGYYEFRDAYEETGQAKHVETIIRYFCDYFMRCTFRDENGDVVAFCYQVGDGDVDHAFWQLPQNDTMVRTAWFATADNPTTCNVSNTAACLAINYLNFKDSDPEYAEKCLDYAKALFNFATDNPKDIADTEQGPKSYYVSTKWEDDYCFASCWLYLITGEKKYIDYVLPILDYYASPSYVYCWNDMWNGVNLLLGIISDTYKSEENYTEAENPNGLTDLAMDYCKAKGKITQGAAWEVIDFWGECAKGYVGYMNGKIGTITPQGYFWLNTWGSCRYNTAAQFTMLVYDKYNKGKDKYTEDAHVALPDYSFSEWAKGQMEYILGKNDITFLETLPQSDSKSEDEVLKREGAEHGSRCFLVGYDENSACNPHHRAASGLTKCEDRDQQLYVLFGALCGGPDANDGHNDLTKDWIYNEVTIDYNAACPGAAAGLYLKYKDQYPQAVTPDFPPENDGGRGASGDSSEGSGAKAIWVESCGIDDLKPLDTETNTKPGVTKVSMMVKSNMGKSPENLTVRYYFDISEVKNFSLIESKILYDQVRTEAAPNYATITDPIKWDRDSKYGYVELNWGDYNVVNCGKKVQIVVGFYYGDTWDPENDPSHKELKVFEEDAAFFATGNEVRNDYICVYSDGVLIGGIEPDGSVPAVPDESTAVSSTSASKTTATSSTASTSSKIEKGLKGDTDCNGIVELRDAVMLAKASAGIDVGLSTSGKTNADINGDGVLNSTDLKKLLAYLSGAETKL